jgi:hypothetical protein
MLLMALINNIACLQTFLWQDIRLTNCGILQIWSCFAWFIGMELRMLIMLEFDSLTQASEMGKSSQKAVYKYRYILCT